MNSRLPMIPAQTNEMDTSTTHSNAGIAPNDFRAIPHIHAATAVATEATNISKQKVSTVCGLIIRHRARLRFNSQHLLNCRRDATLVIRKRDLPSSRLQLLTCILHDKRDAGEGKHLRVIMIITDGHDLLASNSTMPRPPLQSVSLGTIAVEHINDRQVARRILRPHDCKLVFQSACFERPQGLTHPPNGTAKHSLKRICHQTVFDGDDKVDELQILFQPALNANRQLIHVFEY